MPGPDRLVGDPAIVEGKADEVGALDVSEAPAKQGKSLTGRTLAALAWQFANKAIEAGGRILVMIVLARLLSPHAFGVASAGLLVAALGITMTQLGVAPAIVQRPNLTKEHIGSGFLCSILMGVIGFVVVWLSADAIAAFFRMPELKWVTRAIAFCFPLTAPTMVTEALMMREMAFGRLAKIDTVSFVIGYSAVGIGMALEGFGLWSLVGAQLGQVALRGILILFASRHPVLIRFDRTALGELLRFGMGNTLAELGNFVALQGDNMVIGRTMGAAALGLYSRAYTLLAQPARLVGMVFDRVLFPAMSNVQGEGERLIRAQMLALTGVALVMVPGSALLVLLAPELIHVLLGAKWIGAVMPFQILGTTMVFRTSYKVCDSVIRARGATFRRAWRQWVYAGLVLGGSAVGSRWGLVGVSLGVGLAVFFNYVLMLQLALSLSGGRWGDVLLIYVRVGLGSLPMAVTAAAVMVGLRGAGMSALTVLLGAGSAGSACFLLSLLLMPRFFGPESRWIVHLLLHRTPLRRLTA